jgi:hypothetical protein
MNLQRRSVFFMHCYWWWVQFITRLEASQSCQKLISEKELPKNCQLASTDLQLIMTLLSRGRLACRMRCLHHWSQYCKLLYNLSRFILIQPMLTSHLLLKFGTQHARPFPTNHRQQPINSVRSPCTNRNTKFPITQLSADLQFKFGPSARRPGPMYSFTRTSWQFFYLILCIKTRYKSTFVRSNRQTVRSHNTIANCCST